MIQKMKSIWIWILVIVSGLGISCSSGIDQKDNILKGNTSLAMQLFS